VLIAALSPCAAVSLMCFRDGVLRACCLCAEGRLTGGFKVSSCKYALTPTGTTL